MISVDHIIVAWLLLQNAVDIALAVQDANDPHRVSGHDVEMRKSSKSFTGQIRNPFRAGFRSFLGVPILGVRTNCSTDASTASRTGTRHRGRAARPHTGGIGGECRPARAGE